MEQVLEVEQMLTLECSTNPRIIIALDEEGPFAALSLDGGETIKRLTGFWAEPSERHMWDPSEGALYVLRETDGVWYLDDAPLQTSDTDMSEALKLPHRELMFAMEDSQRRQLIVLVRSQPLGLAWSLQAYIGELPEDADTRCVDLTKRHFPVPVSGDEGLRNIWVELGGDEACKVEYGSDDDGVTFKRFTAGRFDYRLTEAPLVRECRWFFPGGDETTMTVFRPLKKD